MLAFAVDPETGNCNYTEYAEKAAAVGRTIPVFVATPKD